MQKIIRTKDMAWTKLSETASSKHLSRIESKGFQFDIMKMDSNTVFEPHIHADVEWIYILNGGFYDEYGEYGPGDFIYFPEGSLHKVTTGDDGLEVIRCWCGHVKATYDASLSGKKTDKKKS